MTGQQGDNGAWLRAAEAAELLGVSEKTVRRKAKAGQLPARQVSTGHGPAWEVWVSGAEPRPGTGRAQTDTRPAVDRSAVDMAGQVAGHGDAPLLEALQLINKLTEENRNLAGQLGYVQAQLQQRDEQLKALTAPKVDPEEGTPHQTRVEGQQGTVAGEVVSDDPKRPQTAPRKAWWRFW